MNVAIVYVMPENFYSSKFMDGDHQVSNLKCSLRNNQVKMLYNNDAAW
jgi:hypothetical protein